MHSCHIGSRQQQTNQRYRRQGQRVAGQPRHSWPMGRIDEDTQLNAMNHPSADSQHASMKGIRAVHAVQGYMSEAGSSSLSSVREMLPDVTSRPAGPDHVHPGADVTAPRERNQQAARGGYRRQRSQPRSHDLRSHELRTTPLVLPSEQG